MPAPLPTNTSQLDPSVLRMVRAIRTVESGGQPNYNAVGDNATSTGAFQFQKPTWQGWAKEVLGNANAEMTPANQNKVAYSKIAQWKAQGFTPQQVAAAWNAGETNAKDGSWATNVGTTTRNGQTLSFDTPGYVNKVIQTAMQYKSLEAPAQPGTVQAAGAEMPQQPPAQPQPEKTPGIAGKLARFLGIESFGQGIGLALFHLTPEYKELEKLLDKGAISPEEFQSITTGNLTNKQVLAGAANTALTIGTAGMGGAKPSPLGSAIAGNIESNLVKPGVGSRILSTVGMGAKFGAASGAINAFGEDKNVLAGAAQGAAIGGALGGIGGVTSEALSALFTKIPEVIANQAFRSTKAEIKGVIAKGEASFGKQVLEHGFVGTNKQAYVTGLQGVTNHENQLQSILQAIDIPITKKELSPFFQEILEKYKGTPGMESELKMIRKVVQAIPEEMTASEANQMKRNLYNILGDRAYKFDATLASKRNAQKVLARGLKELIEKKAQESGAVTGNLVKSINQELAFYGKLRDRALDNMASKSGIGLHDLAALGLGELTLGHPGAIGAELTRRVAGTTIAKTATAQGLKRAGEFAGRTPQGVREAGMFGARVIGQRASAQ